MSTIAGDLARSLVTPTPTCRLCGGEVVLVVDLGTIAISGFPLPHEADPPSAPLDLGRCWECGLVQLRHAVDPAFLFGAEYWYRSGVNETMVAELQDIVRRTVPEFLGWLRARDIVVDIGANDGTLLKAYGGSNSPSPYRVAYEPSVRWAEYLGAVCRTRGERIVEAFPPPHRASLETGGVKVVTSIACFYDVADPRAFVREIRRILHPSGIWILQLQDLDQMLRATAFDNICHEHVVYYSLRAIRQLTQEEGLHVIHAERRGINGGSLRIVVGHAERWARPSVVALLVTEAACESWERLEAFAAATTERLSKLHDLLTYVRTVGQTVDLYGASTKANTWLQAGRFGPMIFRQAWERTPEKWGRVTAGSRIPIVAEEDGRRDPPDLLVGGIWQFREAIIAREAEYLQQGRGILFPFPVMDLVMRGGRS